MYSSIIKLIIILLILNSCENNSSKNKNRFDENIGFVCNQGSGYLTVIDLKSMNIIDEVNLSKKLQDYVNKGNEVDEFYVNGPLPHYVQPSYDGKYLYIVLTAKRGALIKLNTSFTVINFIEIKNTTFPAHLQLSKDNNMLYLSTWTTNSMGSPDGSSSTGNYMINIDHNFENQIYYITPAGAHGIKLTPDESKVIIGHDLSDYINIIPTTNLDNQAPLSTAKAIVSNADINGGKNSAVHSPSQIAVSPDNLFAYFSCRLSSKILVYDIVKSDTLGFIDLKSLYNIEKAGPYSIEVGPKIGYTSSLNKYLYINLKDGGYFGRIKIDYSKSGLKDRYTASQNDIITLKSNNARPHGLDITDNADIALVSSEFSNDDSSKSNTFIIDLKSWVIKKEFETKIHSRGVAIYPSVGN